MFGPNVTVHTVPATATIVPIHVRRVTIARLTSFEKSTYGHHTSAQVREWRATTACAKAHVSHKLHRLDRHHNRGSRKRKGREVEQRTGDKDSEAYDPRPTTARARDSLFRALQPERLQILPEVDPYACNDGDPDAQDDAVGSRLAGAIAATTTTADLLGHPGLNPSLCDHQGLR